MSNTDTQTNLTQMATLTSLISRSCTMQVNTDQYFGDNVTRTLDLSKLTTINSLRGFMPSFQRNDLTAAGVWPDPTFNGAFVPGIPPGFFDITYDELGKAY